MIRARRERIFIAALVGVALALTLVTLDARTRSQSASLARMTRVVRTTGLSDLALSSSSRWLRTPSLAEPNAALWDAPLGLDVDPAGASIGAPER